jgi:hypothetical protein
MMHYRGTPYQHQEEPGSHEDGEKRDLRKKQKARDAFSSGMRWEQADLSWTIISITIMLLGMESFYKLIGFGPHLAVYIVGAVLLLVTIISMITLLLMGTADVPALIGVRVIFFSIRVLLLIIAMAMTIWVMVALAT